MNFYSPPPVITASLYVRIPDDLRCLNRHSEWLSTFTRPFQNIFLEGPIVDENGNLFCVDIPYGRILKITPDKHVEVCIEWDGEPNGLARRPDGSLLIADYKQVGPGNDIALLPRRNTNMPFRRAFYNSILRQAKSAL